MKKNKIISIIYLAFITTTILTAYIDAKAHNKVKYNVKEISRSINNFKILVIAKQTNVSITKDTINQLNKLYYHDQDDLKNDTISFIKNIDYKVSGDTLFIHKTSNKQLYIKAKEINQIIANEKSKVDILKFTSENLIINSQKANVYGRKNNIQNLTITASNHSNINFYNSNIDSLTVYASNSEIYNVGNKTKTIKVKLKDSSYLRTSETLLLNVLKDKTSRYYVSGK